MTILETALLESGFMKANEVSSLAMVRVGAAQTTIVATKFMVDFKAQRVNKAINSRCSRCQNPSLSHRQTRKTRSSGNGQISLLWQKLMMGR